MTHATEWGRRAEALYTAAYARKYRVGRVEGFHHYLFTQDSIKVVGTLWLRYIDSGFFD